VNHPHVSQFDRDAIEDRGLLDDDNTEEMRTAPAMSSVGALGGGRPNQPITRKADS